MGTRSLLGQALRTDLEWMYWIKCFILCSFVSGARFALDQKMSVGSAAVSAASGSGSPLQVSYLFFNAMPLQLLYYLSHSIPWVLLDAACSTAFHWAYSLDIEDFQSSSHIANCARTFIMSLWWLLKDSCSAFVMHLLLPGESPRRLHLIHCHPLARDYCSTSDASPQSSFTWEKSLGGKDHLGFISF